VLISSSPLTSASWQTAPNLNSHQVAQSVHSENGSASTAQPANSPAAQSTEHTASDQAQQKDATGAEVPHPVSRRGAIKIQDSHTADSSTADSQATLLAGNMPQMPFQAVLNDVLPQLEPGVPAQFAKQAANELSDGQLGQDPGKAAADTLLHGKTGIETRAAALAPAIQITKQSGTPNDLRQRLADGETAFAARVVQRAGVAATVALRDAQSVISSSRFDAPKNGAATTEAEPQVALTVKKSDAPAAQTKAPADQAAQPASGSQLAGDANSNQDSDAQRDTGPAADAVADLRASANGVQDAPTTVQPAQGNLTGTGTMPSAPPETHSTVAAKATAESGAPQLLEPQADNASRAGESVRNISLRLTNAEQGSVQVRLSERAGELHVSVRTPDTGLTRGLRDGLPDLMSRLQVNGYRAETWQPGGNGSNAGQDHGHDAPGHGNSQQRNGGGQQQNSQDQQQDEPTPQWVRELETSIQRSN
jgi:hypothetical protein